MIRQSTIDKLHDMHLSAMSDAFESQCADPDTYHGLSFDCLLYTSDAADEL